MKSWIRLYAILSKCNLKLLHKIPEISKVVLTNSTLLRAGFFALLGVIVGFFVSPSPLWSQENHDPEISKKVSLHDSLQQWDGLQSFRNVEAGNLAWLLNLSPEAVNHISFQAMENHALRYQQRLEKYHLAFGQIWKSRYLDLDDAEPLGLGPGSDSALFTGYTLAASVYRFQVTQSTIDLNRVYEIVKGIHLLTHASGTPGVLVRVAYPLDPPHNLWNVRKKKKYIYTQKDPLPQPDSPDPYPLMWFYTRTTRDQLTGVLFGLAVAWTELHGKRDAVPQESAETLEKSLNLIQVCSKDLLTQLQSNHYVLRDHLGRSGTSARKVNGYLRLQLLALQRRILIDDLTLQKKETGTQNDAKVLELQKIRNEYDRYFKWVITKRFIFDPFQQFNHFSQYYAWNLRFARSYSIFICDTNYSRKGRIFNRMNDSLWRARPLLSSLAIRDHQNTFFTFLFYDVWKKVYTGRDSVYRSLHLKDKDNPENAKSRLNNALWQLKSLTLRPQRSWPSPLFRKKDYPDRVLPVHLRTPTQHFIWQKPPDYLDLKRDKTGRGEATGLDYLLPYWMGRCKFPELFLVADPQEF